MNLRLKTRFSSAFTLVEVMMATGIAAVVTLGVFALANSAQIVSAKCFAINITSNSARNTMDRIQLLLQQSYTRPMPINSQGADLVTGTTTGAAMQNSGYCPVYSGTSYMTLTGTGPGIRFDRVLGGPYTVTIPSGGIPVNATSIDVVIASNAQILPPVPRAGDILSIYTTAVMSGTDNQVRATVSSTSPSTLAATGTNTYTVTVVPPLKTLGDGTALGSGTTGIKWPGNDSKGNPITFAATLLRPTALVIVPVTTTTGTSAELRFIDGYTLSGTNVNVSGTYSVLTNEIQPPVSTSGTDATPSGFGIVKMSSGAMGDFVSVILHVRSQAFDRVLAKKQSKDSSTFMGVSSLVPLKSKPD